MARAGLRKVFDICGKFSYSSGKFWFPHGCCPLVAPSSFPCSSWDGVSADRGYALPSIFVLLCSSPEEQGRLASLMVPGKVCFLLTRKPTLHSSTERALRQGGQVVTVFKKGSRVATCKGSYKTGKLKTLKSRENGELVPMGQ